MTTKSPGSRRPAQGGRRFPAGVSIPVPRPRVARRKQDEIQQAPHGPGRSMSSAPAGGGEPGIGSRRRSPATLVTRCPHRLLPAVKALRAAAAASRLGRA